MIIDLLRNPQATIIRATEDPNATLVVPMAGYFFLSLAQGNERLFVTPASTARAKEGLCGVCR